MLLGFEAVNEPRDFTPDEWAKVDRLGSRVLKLRPYNIRPSLLNGIRDRNLAVILRPDSDGDIDVPARVQELSRAAWLLRTQGIGDITVICDNEGNLGSKPVPPDYWQKVSQVVTGLYYGHFDTQPLAGTVKYASPPLAVAQNDEAWYEAGKDILPAFDCIAIHAYGQLNADLVHRSLALAKRYGGGLPLLADEVGDSHPTAGWDTKAEALRVYLDLLRQSGVTAACLFILGGTPDWANFHIPLEHIGTVASGSEPKPPQSPPEPAAPSLVARALALAPGPQRPASKPLVWTWHERNITETASYRPNLSPDEVVTIALGLGATISMESGGDLHAKGDWQNRPTGRYACSRSLFQTNSCGGAGSALMQRLGLTSADQLENADVQYLHARLLIDALETELYWSRQENRPFQPGKAIQSVQRSSSDPTGAGYQAAYETLRRELTPIEGNDMAMARIGNLDVIDVRGRYPSTYTHRDLSQITNISIHHSATPTLPDDASDADELAALDAIHTYHSDTYKGIAYPMVVFPSGRCYLTGDWDTIRYVVGGAGNITTLSILLHGTFTDTVPGPKQIEGARTLIPNVRYQLGNGNLPVVGHKEIASAPTACPGDTWDIWKPWLTEDAASPMPVDTRTPLHIQLDSLFGLISQVTDDALRQQMFDALYAAKDEAGIR